MTRIFSIIALIAWSALSFATEPGYDGARLHVRVENLKNDKGQVIIAIFDNKKDYLKKPVGEAAVKIGEDLTSETEFGNLPAGTYAIAAYHDKNKNGDLDTLLVVPKEDYGFSNNARSLFGPPSFKKAAFEFNGSEDLHITIRAK